MSTLASTPLTLITGTPTSLDDFPNQVLLIVNVASKCGLTPQYTALENLYQQFKGHGFSILGFPANDFAGQEPGTDAEIAAFCSTEYPVTFPIFAKSVVTGPGKSPLFAALIAAAPEHVPNPAPIRAHLASFAASKELPGPNELPEVLWNFEKFLVGKDRQVLARFAPDVTPDDPRIVTAIEEALAV